MLSFRGYVLAAAAAWTIIVFTLLGMDISQTSEQIHNLAKVEARALCTSYKRMLRPEFMTRDIHELEALGDGRVSRLTSLHPLSPENAPVPWEADALGQLGAGKQEVSSVFTDDAQSFLRYAGPVTLGESCLACHGGQGYSAGDLYGAVSLSLPLTPYLAEIESHRVSTSLKHVLLWAFGLLGLWIAAGDLGRRIRENRRALEALRESESRFVRLLHASDDPILLVDEGRVVECNQATVDLLGYVNREDLLGARPSDFSPNQQPGGRNSAEAVERVIGLAMERGFHRFEWVHQRRDGGELPVEVSLTPISHQGKTVLHVLYRDLTRLKQAEETLLESRAFLDQLVETMPIPVFYKDAEGRYLGVNKAFEVFSGKPREALVGKTVFETHPPELARRYHEQDQALLAVPKDQVYEGQVVNVEGETRDVVFHKASFTDAHGEVAGLVGALLDITEHRRIQAELTRRVAFEQTVSTVSSCFVGLRPGGMDSAIENALRSVGHFAHADRAYLFQVRDDAQRMDNTHEWCRDGVAPQMTELQKIAVNQELPWLWGRMLQGDAVSVPDVGALPPEAARERRIFEGQHIASLFVVPVQISGRLLGLIGLDMVRRKKSGMEDCEAVLRIVGETIAHAIEREKASRALAEERRRLERLINTAHDAIIMMDAGGRIALWNDSARRIFGYTANEAVGKNLHDLLAPKRFHADHLSAFERFRETGEGAAVGNVLELAAVRRGGEEFPVELALSSIRFRGEWHAIGVLRDITERKRAEDELRLANAGLEESTARANDFAAEAAMANAAKSEFLANMSHEIRTPMNGVIGMTGLLLDTDLNEEQRGYAETVRASGETLLALINDILDFSKIEAGKLEIETLDFDLRDLMDDFGDSFALPAHDKNLELVCTVAPDVPTRVSGDPGRLRQVLTNLVGNAIKFTSEGEVSVRIAAVSCDSDSVRLRFQVADTGIGIPESKQDALFTSFTQVDASTTRQYGGTGLGLAISKQLVELMGGDIGLTSKPGKGSVFWFDLPLQRQTGQPASLGAVDTVALDGVAVLVVDDNATNRDVMDGLLGAWGMQVCSTPDGPSALEALRAAAARGEPYRVAIIDMQMPGMDGVTLGKTIREDESLCATELLMLTSLGRRGDVKQLREVGFAGYLTKPVKATDLCSSIKSLLTDAPDRPMVTRHTLREHGAGSGRVLVAEDNITNQRVALGMLRKMGYRAEAVANGYEAIRALEQVPYDAVLMDVQMPELNGLDATRRIRSLKSSVLNRGVPIIAMTAHAMAEDHQTCIEAGMDDYLSKPVRPEELARVLKRRLTPDRPPASGPPTPGNGIPATNAKLPVFDRKSLLERLMNDDELLEVIIEAFLEDIPVQIATLKQTLGARDLSTAERQAHSIKGAAANVGGEALRAVAAGLEAAIHQGDWEAGLRQIAGLDAEFTRLKEALLVTV